MDAADRALLDALRARVAAGVPADALAEVEALRAAVAGGGRAGARLVLRVWREVLAEAAGPRRVAVWGGRDAVRATELARARFGAAASLVPAAKPDDALTAAEAGAAAVLALDADTPWWAKLLARPALRVFAVLPELAAEGPPGALAVGAVAPEPTGNDRTFWVTDAREGAAAVEAALGGLGLAAEPVAQAGGLKLFALYGYVQAEDERLSRAPGRLSGVIGAATAPFDV